MFVCVYTHVCVCMYVWQCGPTIVWRLALFQFTLVAFSDNETYLHLLLIIRLMIGAVVIRNPLLEYSRHLLLNLNRLFCLRMFVCRNVWVLNLLTHFK